MKNLKHKLLLMSLNALLSIFFVCMSSFVLVSEDGSSQTTSQVTISVKPGQASIQSVFAAVEQQTNFRFFYERNLSKREFMVTIDRKNLSVADALSIVTKETGLVFKQINRTISVKEDSDVAAGTGMVSNGEFSSLTNLQVAVTGMVSDAQGNGLPGVSIKVKGGTASTSTDTNGKYRISVPTANAILTYSYIGFITEERIAGSSGTVNITLKEQQNNLNELVVIGYGTQKKADVTSAVVSVKSEGFLKGAVRDAGQLLQGKVAGLTIGTPSGDPTASTQILLRGTATLFSSVSPLILIDGIPGDLNTLAPEDIESIDVLKDGSAAAIYGTRGTNGVILITSKRANGHSSPTLDYNGYVSTQSFVRLPKMLSADAYRAVLPSQDLGGNTDWVDAVSRSFPISHNHNISLKGGDSKTNYVGSFGYRNMEGIILKSNNRLINSRIDVNHNMFDNKLKFNFNIVNTDNAYNSTGRGESFNTTILRQALGRNPTAPITNPDGSYQEQTAIANYENPVALINESDGKNQSQSTRLSGSVVYIPIEGLQLKALYSRNKFNSVYGYYETKNNISTTRDGLQGYATKSDAQSLDNLVELSAQFNKTIDNHSFSALVGYSYQDNITEGSNMNNTGFPAGNFSYVDNIFVGSGLGLGTAVIGSNKYASNLIGFFSRLTYNYKEKYLLTANLRYEATSKLIGTKNPWGAFPSISAGWRISKEDFMSSLEWISDLKLRAGYGVTGTAPDNYFLGVSLLGYNGSFLIDGKWVPSLAPSSNPNPYLKWELKKETNVGLDFSIFKNFIYGTVDYYNRRTNGLLFDFQVPTPPNLYASTKANAGVMSNKGLEVLVNVNAVTSKNFTWMSSFNFSTNKNKLLSLSNDLYQTTNDFFTAGTTGSPVQTYTHRVQVGEPIGNFYGYKVVDVTADGHWIYEDRNGNQTQTAVEADKKILGNGLPKYYAGWNNNFKYKHWDLGLTMRGAFDYQILNFQRMYSEVPGYTLYNQLSTAYDKVFGKAVLNKNVLPDYNSYYVENGDFWKIDNVTLGYTFKTTNPHIRSARVYASSLNTFTITGYKGMDPEVNRLGLSPGNDDRDKYPSTRVFTVGVSLSIN